MPDALSSSLSNTCHQCLRHMPAWLLPQCLFPSVPAPQPCRCRAFPWRGLLAQHVARATLHLFVVDCQHIM